MILSVLESSRIFSMLHDSMILIVICMTITYNIIPLFPSKFKIKKKKRKLKIK